MWLCCFKCSKTAVEEEEVVAESNESSRLVQVSTLFIKPTQIKLPLSDTNGANEPSREPFRLNVVDNEDNDVDENPQLEERMVEPPKEITRTETTPVGVHIEDIPQIVERTVEPPKEVTKNERMLVNILQELNVTNDPLIPPGVSHIVERVNRSTDPTTYDFVSKHFNNKKFNYTYELTDIFRVWNPYLLVQYRLKKIEYQNELQEAYLFHGTGLQNALDIMTNNFDWRKAEHGRYGWGVSFANNPWYASHYSTRRQRPNSNYTMILAKVLVDDGRCSVGSTNTIIPPTGHTTTNDNKEVLVKYDDGSFYPEFVVKFKNRMRNPCQPAYWPRPPPPNLLRYPLPPNFPRYPQPPNLPRYPLLNYRWY